MFAITITNDPLGFRSDRHLQNRAIFLGSLFDRAQLEEEGLSH